MELPSLHHIMRGVESEYRLLLMFYNADSEKNESAAIELSEAYLCANVASTHRRLMTTTNGYLRLSPVKAEKGDIICILLRSSRPIILRPSGERYLIVGDCYVQGIMEGEAMAWLDTRKCQMETFILG
jgi:hypothetical protein